MIDAPCLLQSLGSLGKELIPHWGLKGHYNILVEQGTIEAMSHLVQGGHMAHLVLAGEVAHLVHVMSFAPHREGFPSCSSLLLIHIFVTLRTSSVDVPFIPLTMTES